MMARFDITAEKRKKPQHTADARSLAQYSVMGQGMELRATQAIPWILAMADFVKNEPPSKIYTAPTPTTIVEIGRRALDLANPFEAKLQRHFPRSSAEFESRKLITRR